MFNKFKADKERFSNKKYKIIYIINKIGGVALAYINPYIIDKNIKKIFYLDSFFKQIDYKFNDFYKIANARNEYNQLY